MPDAAPPLQPECPVGQSALGPLTPERIERALADFRDWLDAPPPIDDVEDLLDEPIEMFDLIGQFTALRHEVNLQTKAARASLEQNAAALQQLEQAVAGLREPPAPVEKPKSQDDLKPLLKALIDVYDALALADRQVDKQKTAMHSALGVVVNAVTIEAPPVVADAQVGESPSFWKRMFHADPDPVPVNKELTDWHRQTVKKLGDREQKAREAADYLRDSLDGLLTGYAMSLNRIDRVLTKFGLETIPCVGQRFDPEFMEVVEAVPNSGKPLGEVLEEVRRGYRWNDAVFRYAQVRVARG